MPIFEIEGKNISELSDGDLRALIGRLCEAELKQTGLAASAVTYGGAQEAPDGGLDVKVKIENGAVRSDFIPRNITGFQVKKHSMGKAACRKEMQKEGTVRPVIEELAKDNGAYIIVSGASDCADKMLSDRIEGMKEAVANLSGKQNLKLDFYGRDRIAQWLRLHPGVSLWARGKLGKPLSGWRPFERWAATPPQIDDKFLTDESLCVCLPNRLKKLSLLEGLDYVRRELRQSGKAIRIIGLSGVGKTRFAQALFESGAGGEPLSEHEAIYADLGENLTPSASDLAADLIADKLAAYLILDNCPPEIHKKLQEKISASKAPLRLLTIEYDISDDKPEETEVIEFEPSGEKVISKLILMRFPALGRVNADKIAEFAGGNARIAIALAYCVEPNETLSAFSDEDLFKRLFNQRKEENSGLLESAEALSLVYSFNVSDKPEDELEALAKISGIKRIILYKNQAELLRRQLAQKRGAWRAVLPHAVANRLARRALENIPISVINNELFKPENMRLFQSCAHRIGYLHDCEAAWKLAESWIAPGAPLEDISACSEEQLKYFNYIAPIFPDMALSLLEKTAQKQDFASRANPNFSVFIRLLYHLAYEDTYFDRALRVLLKFAEREQRNNIHDNAIDYMCSLFSLYLSGTEAFCLPAARLLLGICCFQLILNTKKSPAF